MTFYEMSHGETCVVFDLEKPIKFCSFIFAQGCDGSQSGKCKENFYPQALKLKIWPPTKETFIGSQGKWCRESS